MLTREWLHHADQLLQVSDPTIISITILFRQHPINSWSAKWILLMLSRTRMTRSKRFLLVTTRFVKLLPSSTPRLIPRSRYLPRLRVTGVSGPNYLTQWMSPMLHIFEKSSVRKDERFFYLLRSLDRI